MPAENALLDLGKLAYYTLLYPIQDDDKRTYQRGMYAGETKVEVYFNKAIPLARQIQTQNNLAGQISYYQMYNPIYNLIGNNR